MSQPFFSIVLPTKNRSFLIHEAVECVLAQTFADWELIIADNSDDEVTRDLIAQYPDPRIRYCRSGGLDMADNWEFGAAQAKGEYVCMIHDKHLLKTRALARIHAEVKDHRHPCVCWLVDWFDDRGVRPKVTPERGNGRTCVNSAEAILDGFLTPFGDPACLMPYPQRACMHRDLVARMRSSAVGRLYHPLCPDITCAALLLAYADHVVQINESLVVSATNKHSSGRSFIGGKSIQDLNTSTGRSTEQLLGRSIEAFFLHVPVKTFTYVTNIYSDYMFVRDKVGERLERHPLDHERFFTESFNSILASCLFGKKDIHKDLVIWEEALAKEPADVRSRVAKKIAEKGSVRRQLWRAHMKRLRFALGVPALEAKVKRLLGRKAKPVKWPTALDYVRWDRAQHASETAAESIT
ncbi:MAG: glycosyltransferase family 2 protein [Verrucomicrobiaceae bacterium]|nr:glycosyltransferase family 2 protein [Verrucomicrobiaceae bacterium]